VDFIVHYFELYPFSPYSLFQDYHPDEEANRRQIFMDNIKFIEEYNAREDTMMTLGTNEYADLVKKH
jgi:hypothetical protein